MIFLKLSIINPQRSQVNMKISEIFTFDDLMTILQNRVKNIFTM